VRLEMVTIPSGSVELAGLRYLPEERLRPTALLYAHGFTAGKYSLDSLAGYLAGRGYAGLTFDFVGHKLGGSGGEMRRAQDVAVNLRDALTWLRHHSDAEKIVLIGHSMGAAAALQVAAWERERPAHAEAQRVAGVVCICLGTEPSRGFETAIGKTMLAQRSDYVVGAPARQLLQEVDTMALAAEEIGSLPALFIAARQDALISLAHVEELAELAEQPASVAVVDSSHLEAPDRSRGTIVQWLEKQGF